jgi:hypothetical protein
MGQTNANDGRRVMASELRFNQYPEQDPVREALDKFLEGFDCFKAAASKIGTDTATLRKWRRGSEPIPRWFCEYLGFRKITFSKWVPIGGPVGVTTTEKTA